MRPLYKVAFVAFLCVYLMGPSSFADAACKGSKCSRRRKSEEKQMNKEDDSMTHINEIEVNKKSSEEESEEEDEEKAGGKANKESEKVAQSKAHRMRRDHELKRTHELGETGGVYEKSVKGQHQNRGANHDQANHHHQHRRHVSEDCHSSEGDEAHQKHVQKAEPDSTAPARKRREQSAQVDMHISDNVARHHNRRHVSDDCHSSEDEEAHKKHANKAARRRRRSEHVQISRFEDPEHHRIVMPLAADEAEDKTLSRKPRAYDHDKKWTKRDDELYGVEDLLSSHNRNAHNRRTVKKRDSEMMPNLKYPYEDEIAAVARHRMNLVDANAEDIRYPGGPRVGPFPGRNGRVGPFPEDYPPFVDEHTDVMVERAMTEMEKELKNYRHHKNRLD